MSSSAIATAKRAMSESPMSGSTAKTTSFFTVGGTLRPHDPSYVTRAADRILEEQLRAGVFCAVLTARQMGKSSLMVRTARRLAAQGTRCAVVDLTAIGTKVAADGWYLGVLTPIRNQLRLTVDVSVWWAERQAMGAPERFAAFLRDVALAQEDTPLVIFIDEIDTTLALNTRLRDDFFVAIRAIANERANTSGSPFTRLTFAFFGVATPDDLVGDRRRTAFNIGTQISLDDLNLNDAIPLQTGLDQIYPGHGTRILQQIFEWAGGHPYLTQKLCAVAAHAAFDPNDDHTIDRLVYTEILDEGANDDNIAFVRNRMTNATSEGSRALFALYRRVLRDELVPDDETSIVQNRLELAGLVKVVGGRLVVRNKIYRNAFDEAWVRATVPTDNRRRLAITSMVVAILAVLVVSLGIWLRPTDEDSRAQALADGFIATLAKDPNTDTPADHRQRLDSLEQLFQLQRDQAKYRELALSLFYDRLSFERQQALFKRGDSGDGSKLIRVATAIVATLGPEGDGSDLSIISAIVTGLNNVQATPTGEVRSAGEALQNWLQLRQSLRNNNTIDRSLFVLESSSSWASTKILGTVSLTENLPAPAFAFDIARAWNTETTTNTKTLAILQNMLETAAIQPTPLPTITTGDASESVVATSIGSGNLPSIEIPTIVITSPEPQLSPITALPSPPLTGKGLRQTHRFRNRQEIEQTIREFLRANPGLMQVLTQNQKQYGQLADLIALASVPTSAAADDVVYIVQPGDSLSSIAYAFYGNTNLWVNIYSANADVLNGSKMIFAGERLKIPSPLSVVGATQIPTITSPSTSAGFPTVATVQPAALFTSVVPSQITLVGTNLDQVRVARLVSQGHFPIDLSILTLSPDQLLLAVAGFPETITGEVSYQIELSGRPVQQLITVRDFISTSIVKGVLLDYFYTGRVFAGAGGVATRLRTQADQNSEQAGLLQNGDQVQILQDTPAGWYQVRVAQSKSPQSQGQVGWIEQWLVNNTNVPPQTFVGRLSSTPTDNAVRCGTSFESTIYGSVENVFGDGVRGATIRVTSSDGRARYTVKTAANGNYTVPGLGCTTWIVTLVDVPNQQPSFAANKVTVGNLNGGKLTAAEVRFKIVN